MKRHDPNFSTKSFNEKSVFASDKINEFEFVLKDKKKVNKHLSHSLM